MRKFAIASAVFVAALCAPSAGTQAAAESSTTADRWLIVDCLLPGQVRKLGGQMTFLTARRPVKSSAAECEIRGGEYIAYDRANLSTALGVWLAQANGGDLQAQTYVGEIHEKGLGVTPNFEEAARWYRMAAEKGYSRAQSNLGFLFEKGLGVKKDLAEAQSWYRKAAGLPDDSPIEAPRPATPAGTAPAPAAGGNGPSIQIIDPPVVQTRGNPTALVRSGLTVLPLIGKVTAPGGVISLTINDHKETPDRNGLFRTEIAVLGKDTPVKVVAVDAAGTRIQTDFTLVPDLDGTRGLAAPKSLSLAAPKRGYALLIGNNDYRKLPKLETAIDDVKAIADVLANTYGYQVTVMTNASRYDILSKLNEFREKLTENDSFILYYAGHGELDRANLRGHWLPIDAEPDSPANWISNVAVTDLLNAMAARQALIIADTCYAGAMTRAVFEQTPAANRKGIWRSRTVLSSGGLKPVVDGEAGSKHSVFAQALLDTLRANRTPVDGLALYQRLAGNVARAAMKLGVEQIPEYAPIRFAGHEAGDFLLAPRKL
ncbi:MAG: caspase family protein [Burkholderiales bacterium]|nr:caspase family protein [Burkholderiales bacterium]